MEVGGDAKQDFCSRLMLSIQIGEYYIYWLYLTSFRVQTIGKLIFK